MDMAAVLRSSGNSADNCRVRCGRTSRVEMGNSFTFGVYSSRRSRFALGYSSETNFGAAFMMCVAPFIIPDAVKTVVAVLVVSRLKLRLVK